MLLLLERRFMMGDLENRRREVTHLGARWRWVVGCLPPATSAGVNRSTHCAGCWTNLLHLQLNVTLQLAMNPTRITGYQFWKSVRFLDFISWDGCQS